MPAAQSGSASATQSTARQVGAAVGSAISGTALAAALGWLLPGALANLPHLDPATTDQLQSTVVSSAGGVIPMVRAGSGPFASLGDAGPAVAHTLADVFGQATGVAVAVAAVLLALGLVGALRVAVVARVAGATDQPLDEPTDQPLDAPTDQPLDAPTDQPKG